MILHTINIRVCFYQREREREAFLNGDLNEELYMKLLEGYAIPGKENMACKLRFKFLM